MGLINIQMTNFENGVNNRNAANLFGSMGQLDPTKYHTHMEDFDRYAAGEWNVSGTGTEVLVDVDGGVLRMTTGASLNNNSRMVKVGEGFQFELSRPMYYRGRMSVNDSLDAELVIGLAAGADLVPTSGVVFQKLRGTRALSLIVRAFSVTEASAGNIANISDDENFTVEWYWDGIDRVYYGVNGNPQGYVTFTVIPNEQLAPSVGVIAGAASVMVADVDYLFTAKYRG